MPKHLQTNLSVTSINTNEPPVSVPATPGGLLPTQQDISAKCTTLDSTGKEGDSAEQNEPHNFIDRGAKHETEYLLKFIASLESCNATLCNKLAQLERELATLRNPAARTVPRTESTDSPEQLYGYSRKLTRMGWRHQ